MVHTLFDKRLKLTLDEGSCSVEYTLNICVIKGSLDAKKASLISMMDLPSSLMVFEIPYGHAFPLASSSLTRLSSSSWMLLHLCGHPKKIWTTLAGVFTIWRQSRNGNVPDSRPNL